MFHVHLAAVVGKGIEAALHAEGKQDAPVGVRCKGGVFGRQTVSQTLFNAVGKDPLPCPGEKDVHRLLVLNKGMEQFTGQLLCVCSGKPHIGHTVQNDMDELVLQPAGQLIDILIVGIKGGFVHLGQCAQVFDPDLLQRLAGTQLHECLFDGAVSLFNADVQNNPPLSLFRWISNAFRFSGIDSLFEFSYNINRESLSLSMRLRSSGMFLHPGSGGCAGARRRSSG